MTKRKLLAGLVAILISVLAAPAASQDGDVAARDTIARQLESFLSGDFANAYSFASNDIKRIYPTLDSFMAMVKNGYLPVLSPGNYAFGRTETITDGRIVQEVLIRAPDGSDWTAVYFMEQQDDGIWKVDGVTLKKGAAGMT